MTLRCAGCNRKLAEFVEGRAVIRCRCGTVNILQGQQQVTVTAISQLPGRMEDGGLMPVVTNVLT